MQPVAHVLEYYRTKLAWADAADWPHVHLRECVRHYEILIARTWTADISELGIARAKKTLKLSGPIKTISLDRKPAQTDIEHMLDKNHELKTSLRRYVLDALDSFAIEAIGANAGGWKNSDLPTLYRAIDSHLATLLKRYGLDQ